MKNTYYSQYRSKDRVLYGAKYKCMTSFDNGFKEFSACFRHFNLVYQKSKNKPFLAYQPMIFFK